MTQRKRKIAKEDIHHWDGSSETFSAESATGRPVQLNSVDWVGVDVEGRYGSRSGAAISAAVARIGSTAKATIWLSPGQWTLTADLTISSNITLAPAPGAYITLGTYDLTINGPFVAALNQVFDVNSTGAVSFAVGSTTEFYLEWWDTNPVPGTTNTTANVQRAMTAAAGVGKLIITPGTYMIDPTHGVSPEIPSNSTIEWMEGAEFHAITNALDNYRILYIASGSSDITLINPFLVGDRDTHTGGAAEWGHCIWVSGTDIHIIDITANDAYGDGIYLTNGTNIVIDNALIDSARRNGISIISGTGITINNPYIANINGTAPQAGIDIEPNANTEVVRNIVINNPTTDTCVGGGVFVALDKLKEGTTDVSITVNDHVSRNDGFGTYIGEIEYTAVGKLTGRVTINNPFSFNSTYPGVAVYDYESNNTPEIYINHPVVHNPNSGGSAVTVEATGILIYGTAARDGSVTLGNTTIVHAEVFDNRAVPLMVYGVAIIDDATDGFSKINFIDPIRIEGHTAGVHYKMRVGGGGADCGGLRISDRFKVLSATTTDNMTLYQRAYTQIDNTGDNAKTVITLPSSLDVFDNEITFINMTASGMQLAPTALKNIIPDAQTVNKYIESTDIGASITLNRWSTTAFMIVRSTGTWSVEA